MNDERPMAKEHRWSIGEFEYFADTTNSCMVRRVGSGGPWSSVGTGSAVRELLHLVAERDLELAHRQEVERQRGKTEEIQDLRAEHERLIHERESLYTMVAHQHAALYLHAQGVDDSGLIYCKMCGGVSTEPLTPSDHREGCLLARGADPKIFPSILVPHSTWSALHEEILGGLEELAGGAGPTPLGLAQRLREILDGKAGTVPCEASRLQRQPEGQTTMPRVKFKPETGYFINPTPDVHGTLGLSIYFGKTVDGVPSVGLRPKGGPEGSSWVMSKEAALLLSLLIQAHFGAEWEGDFSPAA